MQHKPHLGAVPWIGIVVELQHGMACPLTRRLSSRHLLPGPIALAAVDDADKERMVPAAGTDAKGIEHRHAPTLMGPGDQPRDANGVGAGVANSPCPMFRYTSSSGMVLVFYTVVST